MATTAGEKVILKDTGLASTDLSGAQYTFVTLADDAIAAAGAGVAAYVLTDTPSSGQHGTVALAGIVPVLAGAAVTAGDRLMSNASAKAVTATATNVVNGIALTGAAGADELIEMLIVAPVVTL